ncbi:MAG: hypothetical protein Q9204_006364 [Flavoplaca sp. TL-2023a]
MYKRNGQTQQWFNLRGQVQQVLNRSHKAPQTFRRIGMNYVGRDDYYFEDIEELIALSIRRKSYWQAELMLEATASHLRDQPWNKEFIWCLDKLVELYIQSVERAKSTLNNEFFSEKDMEEVASTLILDCAARIDFDALSNRLINKHPIILTRYNRAAMLYCAIARGACNLVRIVLGKASLYDTQFSQALVNGKEDQHKIFRRRPPLHLAIGFGYIDMVRLLVTRGADLEAKTQNYHKDEDEKDDSRYEVEEVPLHVAIKEGRLLIVIYLLSLHANIEARCGMNETPLMKAASRGDPDIVRYLLERGARVDQVDRFGQTALHHAVEGGQAANIRLILASGADIMARDVESRTALHFAVDDRCPNMIDAINVLLYNAAYVDAKDHARETALHLASDCGNLSAAELLLNRGASVSAVGRLGTPLHYAARAYPGTDNLPIVKAILRNGAEVNERRPTDGRTSLHLAVLGFVRGSSDNARVLEALCRYGADATIRDNYMISAFDYAREDETATAVLMQYRTPMDGVPIQRQKDMSVNDRTSRFADM